MPRQVMSRRSFNCSALASAIAALLPQSAASDARSLRGTVLEESTRREVIKQRLPGEPQRHLTLVEIVYPPGAGSPPHVHANGVMAFVVSVPSPPKLAMSPSVSFMPEKRGGSLRARSIAFPGMRARQNQQSCSLSTSLLPRSAIRIS